MRVVATISVLFAAGSDAFRLRRSNYARQANSTVAGNSTAGMVSLTGKLAEMGDQCQCHFRGLCTCDASVQFMDCIADSCASGLCDCKRDDFFDSCNAMAATCPTTGLFCTEEKATCEHTQLPDTMTTAQLQEELAGLKKRKCQLKDASEAGYVNAGIRLKQVKITIQGHLDMLRAKGVKEAPYMGCGPAPAGDHGKDWVADWKNGGEAMPV